MLIAMALNSMLHVMTRLGTRAGMRLAVIWACCRSMQAGVGLDRLIRRALQTGGAGPKQRSRAGDFTMKFGMVVMAVGEEAAPEVAAGCYARLMCGRSCVSVAACLPVPAVCRLELANRWPSLPLTVTLHGCRPAQPCIAGSRTQGSRGRPSICQQSLGSVGRCFLSAGRSLVL